MTTGILITNLGTPAAPTKSAVRKYLAEFLSDPRVVELPAILWQPILQGIVLNTRPKKSAALYQKIWTEEGSPLLATTKKQAEKLAHIFQQLSLKPALPNNKLTPLDVNTTPRPFSREGLDTFVISFGMRYGEPSLKQGLEELKHCHKIIILPLYPQYSATTTGSTFDAIANILKKWRHIPEIKFINQYAEEPGYIQALASQIKIFWQQNQRGEKLLFSFHGLPKNSIAKGDPYYSSCQKTAALVAAELKLSPEKYEVVFQSRFGAQEWLQPYCDITLQQLPKQEHKKIDIICPGFAADCLETLEEIAMRNTEIFLEAGGEQLNYIPALNDTEDHLNFLADLIQRHL